MSESRRDLEIVSLRDLARAHGVQTAYIDLDRKRRVGSPEVLLQVLGALGLPIQRMTDVPRALKDTARHDAARIIEPVILAREGRGGFDLNLASRPSARRAELTLKLEHGKSQSWIVSAAQLGASTRIRFPHRLPLGYHRIEVKVAGKTAESLVVSHPARTFAASGEKADRAWGVFLPLYALATKNSLGVGDFTDLEKLIGWVAGEGGSIVATLPFLASFLDEPYCPSPYAPISRQFWNELFVDPRRVPELERCPEAHRILASSGEEIERLRAKPMVDYRGCFKLKRRLLEALAESLFSGSSSRWGEFEEALRTQPELERYARFRAAVEFRRENWQRWPEAMRSGTIGPSDFDDRARKYHLYAQWIAGEQVASAGRRAREAGRGLYLDLPLGAHPDGYDLWSEPEAFASGLSAGAPPDPFFTRGQSWGFPPLHPRRIREQGYRYVIACYRHQLRNAGMMRVDHIMGLHRLYSIPSGIDAKEGVYLNYHAEELYAILALESVRAGAVVIGEDLGTVPKYVRQAMKRHGISGMSVTQFECQPDARRAVGVPAAGSVASLNTHDMAPFRAFWEGSDIDDRRDLGLLDKDGVEREKKSRERLTRAVARFLRFHRLARGNPSEAAVAFRGLSKFLAASAARAVLVNIEDLWGESLPQNTPGTMDERPNWQRKARRRFEQFAKAPGVIEALREIDRLRRKRREP